MRPLVVLSLVIVAVAALLFAIFALGEDSEPGSVAVSRDPAVASPGPAGPAAVGNLEAPTTQPAPVTREAEPSSTERETLGAARAIYENALAGQITDPDGLPLEDAKVMLNVGSTAATLPDIQRLLRGDDEDGRRSRSDTTDLDGNYRFRNLEPGAYTLVVQHPEFSRAEEPMVNVLPEGESIYDVQLQEGLIVHGWLRNENGRGVEGADVQIDPSLLQALFAQRGSGGAEIGERVSTDETGYYRFANVAPGQQYNVTALAAGYGRESMRSLRVTKDTSPVEANFTLVPGVEIAGRVFAPDRSGIQNATVTVIGYQQPQTLHATAMTDENGDFSIPDLMPGTYVLRAEAAGWGKEQLNRIEAPDAEVEVEMAEQGSVSGLVVADVDGDPISAFKVSLHQYVSDSSAYGRPLQEQRFEDEGGRFELRGIPEGQYGLKVQAAGYAVAVSDHFAVTQGLETTDILVRLGRGGTLVGQVIDAASGKPVAGATVQTRDNNFVDNPLMRMFGNAMPRRTSEAKVRTDEEGRFELTLLMPELYQIEVSHPKFPTTSMTNIRVHEGVENEVGPIRLTPGSDVRGTVFDQAGQPLAGATVQLTSTAGDQMMHFEARTGRDGRYLLPNIPDGSFKLHATRPTTNENPFQTIIDMKKSEVQMSISRGRDYTQDLYLGG